MMLPEEVGRGYGATYQPIEIRCDASRLTLASIAFGPVITAAAGHPTVTTLIVPRSDVDKRHTLSSLRARLGRIGRAAAAGERQHLDRELKAQFNRSEISAVFYYRCLARMTQEDLAARSLTRQSYLSQIEKGRRPLTWKQAEKLAPHLGVTASSLLEKRTNAEE